jgi:hypothetical protein
MVVVRGKAWFVLGTDGEDLAGPFVTLRQVEDYLDAAAELPAAPPAKVPVHDPESIFDEEIPSVLPGHHTA